MVPYQRNITHRGNPETFVSWFEKEYSALHCVKCFRLPSSEVVLLWAGLAMCRLLECIEATKYCSQDKARHQYEVK
jgi:hypothetical protein